MLEYYILSRLCSSLAQILHEKGRSPGGYQVLLVVLYILSEIAGFILGLVIGMIVLNNDDVAWVIAVLGALLGAVCAAGFMFLLVKSLPPLEGAYNRNPDDAYGPGWRKGDLDRLRDYDRPRPRPERLDDPADDRIQE